MWVFLLILGFALLIGGIVCLFNSEDSYDFEGLLIIGGFFGLVGGIALIICSIIGLCGGFEKKTATEVKTEVVSDVQVPIIPSDTIKSIMYIISWKDDDGVWAGRNVKLVGYTNKGVGDTIIVKMQ